MQSKQYTTNLSFQKIKQFASAQISSPTPLIDYQQYYYTMPFRLILLLTLIISILSDCAFVVDPDLKPHKAEGDEINPSPITWQVSCSEWMNETDPLLGCCNQNSHTQTTESFKKIDTIFASSTTGGSGGCDLCAINLKRFWCMYSCAPNQADFVKVGDWVWVPSFDHPGEQVFVQEITLTVESETACSLFQSCQRTSYAAQLSALQSPAGFLNFQGTNAIEDATQIIYVEFTDDPKKGLYIPDFDNCNKTLPPVGDTYRGFVVNGNCTCNTCESKCDGGNFYEPTPVMYGFNSALVASVWGGIILAVVGITGARYYLAKKNKEE